MSKIKNLPIKSVPESNDWLYIVDDAVGVNGGRKTKVSELRAAIEMTAAEVKVKYESNADTNVFSDFEKDSLGKLTPTAQVVTVQKNPGEGQFSDIQEAIDSITDASDAKPYIVNIAPGQYDLIETLILKEHVSLRGERVSTIINQTIETKGVIVVAPHTTVSQMVIQSGNTTGTDVALIQHNGTAVPIDFIMNNVDFGDCHTIMKMEAVAGEFALIQLNSCNFTGNKLTNGFVIEGLGTTVLFVETFVLKAGAPTVAIDKMFNASGITNTLVVSNSLFALSNAATCQTSFHISDGVKFNSKAVGIGGAVDVIHVPNIGVGPKLNINVLGTELISNKALNIEHAGTTGLVYGSFEGGSQIFVADGSPLSINHTIPSGGIGVVGDITQADKAGEEVNFSKLVRVASTLGSIQGGVLTKNATPFDIDISAGVGFINNTSLITQEVNWLATTLTVAVEGNIYVTVDADGLVQGEASFPSILSQRIVLGRVTAGSSGIIRVENISVNMEQHGLLVEDNLRSVFGAIYASGTLISENGTTAREIDISAGVYFLGSKKYQPSGGSSQAFRQVIRDGAGDFTGTGGVTVVPNNLFDDNSGTAAAVPAGRFTKHTMTMSDNEGGESYFLHLSQAHYATSVDATNAPLPILPPELGESWTVIGELIMQEGDNSIIETIDSRPVASFKGATSSSVTVHSGLSGLTADDHLQYSRTDGTRPFTGNIDLGTHDITNVGLVDGVAVDAHAARHLPNGADPLATGIPSAIGTADAEGTANAFARQDHVHSHGTQSTPTHHALVISAGNAGFMSGADKANLDLNTAKVSNATHTGEVTGSTALTVDKTAIANKTLVTADALDEVLIGDNSDAGNLKKIKVSDLLGTSDTNAIHVNVANEITGILEKTTPIAGDWLVIEDSAAANVKKKVQVGNLPYPTANVFAGNVLEAGGTTTSLTDVLMGGLALTPGAGDYLLSFDTDFEHSANGEDITYSIYVNGTQVTLSERVYRRGAGQGDVRTPAGFANFRLTGVLAAQVVDIRWRTSAATATSGNRNFTLIRTS